LSANAARKAARIHVLAGVNGSGKSSIGGATIRAFGADYYNPDEAARAIADADPSLGQAQANGIAWQHGRQMLERAISRRLDFAFETTLGGGTIARLLSQAIAARIEVHVWYVGLADVGLHVARVRARVATGGHDIPDDVIRRRFAHSRLNLIHLLPGLASLRVHDNSVEADPGEGVPPQLFLLLHMSRGRIVAPADLSRTPEWAKPIVAAALGHHPRPIGLPPSPRK
jgi:predicted ABC-type ATPase